VPKDIPESREEITQALNKKSKFPWRNNPTYDELTTSGGDSDDELPSVTYDLDHKSEQD
jgi:hypothetical protein